MVQHNTTQHTTTRHYSIEFHCKLHSIATLLTSSIGFPSRACIFSIFSNPNLTGLYILVMYNCRTQCSYSECWLSVKSGGGVVVLLMLLLLLLLDERNLAVVFDVIVLVAAVLVVECFLR